MNADTELLAIAGPAGRIDVAYDPPAGAQRGVAVIAHPHPLFGGTRDNKVVQTLARALTQAGFACWRPNFRGVGGTEGVHDEGRGETEDLLAVVAHARRAGAAGAGPELVLAGFSFGAFVQTRVASRIAQAGDACARMILVAPAVSRFALDRVPQDTLVVHGDEDDVVPLSAVLDWAKPQSLPILVVPGTGHFFHGQLALLKQIVLRAVAQPVERAGPQR